LIQLIARTDLAHREPYVNQNPFAHDRSIVLKQSQVNLSADTQNFNYCNLPSVIQQRNDLSRYGEAHFQPDQRPITSWTCGGLVQIHSFRTYLST
jgi:hypothetical protein